MDWSCMRCTRIRLNKSINEDPIKPQSLEKADGPQFRNP